MSRWLLVFGVALVADWCVTLYVRRSGSGLARSAAFWNTAFMACTYLLNRYVVVIDSALAVPALAGCFVGTLIATQYDKERA